MRRRWADHGRRLSQADHLEIQRRISEGETFAIAAAAVGCSTKSIQRFMARTGGLAQRTRDALRCGYLLLTERSCLGG